MSLLLKVDLYMLLINRRRRCLYDNCKWG